MSSLDLGWKSWWQDVRLIHDSIQRVPTLDPVLTHSKLVVHAMSEIHKDDKIQDTADSLRSNLASWKPLWMASLEEHISLSLKGGK